MVFGLCQVCDLGAWDHGIMGARPTHASLKSPGYLKRKNVVQMGIRDIGSSPGRAMNLLWELGQLPLWLWASVSLSVLRQVCGYWGAGVVVNS